MDKTLTNKIKELLQKQGRKTDKIPIGWPVYDEKEILAVLSALLNSEISGRRLVEQFEKNFANYLNVKQAVAVNSGSSANFLALRVLLETGELKVGDSVIVPASTFITVATPIVQLGLKPIFVDVELDSYNLDPLEVEKAARLAKAMIVVHSLGNPAKIDQILKIAKKHRLKVIEDCCEAHGAEIDGKKVGSFGDLSTFSFYVAHNITTGEGGMVVTNNSKYSEIARSLREFGRNVAKKRYSKYGQLGEYDNRYVFDKLGFNFRMTSFQAAFGIEQLKKLDNLNKERIRRARFYSENLGKYSSIFHLPKENGIHSFYSYLLVLKDNLPFTRQELVKYLEQERIETRPFFSGSIPDQPAFKDVDFALIGSLKNSKILRDRAFFIGCHPALDKKDQIRVVQTIEKFLRKYKSLTKEFNPKVSVIVISYNKPKLLSQAMESLFNQTYQNFEVILVDGGSSAKGVKKLLDRYSKNPKVKLVYTGETPEDRKTKAMLSVAANIGIEHASGDFITYLCDDDVYLPNRLERMVDYLKINQRAKVVYSYQKVYNLDHKGNKSNIHIRKLDGFRGKAARKNLPLDKFLDVNSFMHSKECLLKLKKPYWPEEKAAQGHNDGIFAEKIGENFIFYPLPEVLDEHRHTLESLNYKKVGKLRLFAKILASKTILKNKLLEIELTSK